MCATVYVCGFNYKAEVLCMSLRLWGYEVKIEVITWMCWINLLCGSQELNQSCRPWLSSHLCQPVYFIAGMCCVSLRWHFESISTKRTIFIKNLGGQHWRHGLYMFLEGHIKWIRDILNGFNYQHWNKISAKKAKYNCAGNGFGILEVSLFLTSGTNEPGVDVSWLWYHPFLHQRTDSYQDHKQTLVSANW